ncbi:hypothetical protein D6C82_10188 [Aureobasidium pullulans]|nr:hypothetical protein D6C82_10188 [Aureobasidium pullulans]
MLNPLRLVLETFGSALGGSPRRSLLSMLNIFEPFFSSTSLGGNNEKRTTRLVQLTELFARKEIAHIRTGDTGTRSTREVVYDRQRAVGDKSARSRNVGSPDVMAPHVSPPTLGRRWSMEIWLLDKVNYPDASGYAEWRQSSGTTQRDRNSKHMIYLFRCWQLGHVRITHTSKVKLIV